MVMMTCSLMLKGPGLRLKEPRPQGRRKSLRGSAEAMKRPSGSTAICIRMPEIVSGCVRNVKNVFRKMSSRTDRGSEGNENFIMGLLGAVNFFIHRTRIENRAVMTILPLTDGAGAAPLVAAQLSGPGLSQYTRRSVNER
ncbi:hypothetical protein ACMD2_13602 [Ananas comosus]|uniref:Uncharacterized protein n=1 Tax=Ananas comosus TaxID=4615 RepID=A0A199V927_ANACO|nr:hypothetical protein ACMD2_13602 [Ananas comosus]